MSQRAGFVALFGRPNVGKSTLLNRLLGESLAIVSPKPQTTRRNLRGVVHRPEGQVVLVDTPGLGRERTLLGRAMRQASQQALGEADVVLVLLACAPRWPRLAAADEQLLAVAAQAGRPVVVALNKVDRLRGREVLLPTMAEVARRLTPVAVVPISAATGEGLEVLLEELLAALPAGTPLYGPDASTDTFERQLVEDLIFRELLMALHQEVPHHAAVVVEQFEDRRDSPLPDCRIAARIYVQRPTQKAIVIGQQGAGVRQVGVRARAQIGRLLGCEVHLTLTVAVAEDWTDSPEQLKAFGLMGPVALGRPG